MAALATAILRGLTSSEHLNKILSRGADVADLSYCDPLGRSLIHLAAEIGDVSAMRWIISHDADPRATTVKEGNTALHVAAAEGNREVVTYLLEDVSVGVAGLNHAGETALDVAIAAAHEGIVAELTRYLRPLPIPARGSEQQHLVDRDSNPRSPSTQDIISKAAAERKGVDATPRHDPASPTALGESALACGGNEGVDGKEADQQHAFSLKRNPASKRRPCDDARGTTKGGFFVAGAWSKAGVCSCFNVRHRNLLGKHGIVFDMGICPSEIVPVRHVFITHGHLDHSGAIFAHARLRALSQGPPARYYMHAKLAAGVEKVRRAFEDIEESEIAMDIVAVAPDELVDLGQGCSVRPFFVQHRVEALGFALIRQRTDGLKYEYRGMDGKALGMLRKRGIDVTLSHETVEVVYTGDTVMAPLVSLPIVWQTRLLIMEVSYLDGDGTAAAKNHHIHIQDVIDNLDKLDGVEQLLIAHVSERYGKHQNVLRRLTEALPSSVVNKVSVALSEFGAPSHLTFLEDYVLEQASEAQGQSPTAC